MKISKPKMVFWANAFVVLYFAMLIPYMWWKIMFSILWSITNFYSFYALQNTQEVKSK